MKLILIAITMLVACTTFAEVKWHPGHYYTIMSWAKNNQRELDKAYNDLKETPSLRGLQIRFYWYEIETSEGVYDFSVIEKRLQELKKINKRLVVLLNTRSFDEKTLLIPEYLKDPKYEGGAFGYSSNNNAPHKGINIKFYNKLLRERFKKLVYALGEKFNKDNNFEAIGLDETSIGGVILEPISKDQINEYYIGILEGLKDLKGAFPNTVVYQFVNYPRHILKDFIGTMKEYGVALGGPDTFPDEVGLNIKDKPNEFDGVYSYYSKMSGIVALTPSVMPTNYYNTTSNNAPGGHPPTIEELLKFDRDVLRATHIFWTKEPKFYPEVLRVLKLPENNRNPEGGLISNCPSAYGECVDKLIPACPVSDKIYSQVELDKILADTIAPLNTKIAENELKITEQTVKISEQETKITELNTNMDQKILEGINTWKADFLVKVKSFIFGINE